MPPQRPVPQDFTSHDIIHTALGYALALKNGLVHWCGQVLNHHCPSGNRLAYVFKPASADTVTLVLCGLILLPIFRAPFLQCLLILGLMCHVGTTWLAHMHNITKLSSMDKIGTSLMAQQRMLAKRHTALQQGVEAVAQLQAKAAVLEERTKNMQQQKERCAHLERLAAKAEALQEQVTVKERAVLGLPRLKARLAHLQARRRLVEKLKWAVRVLTTETSKAATLEAEYQQAQEAKARLQVRKQALQEEAEQVSSLQEELRQLERQADNARHLRAKVEAFKREVAPLANERASNGHRASKGDVRRSVDCLSGRSHLDQTRTHTSSATKAFTAVSELPGAATSDVIFASHSQGTLSRHQLVVHQERGGDPAARPALSTRSSCASVGSSMGLGGVSKSRRRMVLETPSGGSHVFQVVDNEAFYTPMLVADTTPTSGHVQLAFTPGPEASALAAALHAGMPVPTRSRSSTIGQPPVWPSDMVNGDDMADSHPAAVRDKADKDALHAGDPVEQDSKLVSDQGLAPPSEGALLGAKAGWAHSAQPEASDAESLSLM